LEFTGDFSIDLGFCASSSSCQIACQCKKGSSPLLNSQCFKQRKDTKSYLFPTLIFYFGANLVAADTISCSIPEFVNDATTTGAKTVNFKKVRLPGLMPSTTASNGLTAFAMNTVAYTLLSPATPTSGTFAYGAERTSAFVGATYSTTMTVTHASSSSNSYLYIDFGDAGPVLTTYGTTFCNSANSANFADYANECREYATTQGGVNQNILVVKIKTTVTSTSLATTTAKNPPKRLIIAAQTDYTVSGKMCTANTGTCPTTIAQTFPVATHLLEGMHCLQIAIDFSA